MHQPPKKLLDQVRDVLQVKHYSIRTERAFVAWIKRFILLHHKRHPRDMGRAEMEAFLTHLAFEQSVAASTQNHALGAILASGVACRADPVAGQVLPPVNEPTKPTKTTKIAETRQKQGQNTFRLLVSSW